MSVRIVRIEMAGPEARARRLMFDDETTRTTSAAVVKELGLVEGAVVERGQLDEALGRVELPLAKERALRLLGYRERSRAEVAQKLRETGYPADVVDSVVERFAQVELIDDARFSSTWARSRAAGGYGRRRVERELADKGIDETTAAEALADVFAPSDEVARATRALKGRTAKTRAERDRLLRRLISRGFDMSVALAAIDSNPGDRLDTD